MSRRSRDRFRGHERDQYAEVGAAMRDSIEVAIETAEGREVPRAARVLFAVHHMLASYSKMWDTVYLAQLCELARIPGDTDGKITAHYLRAWNLRGALIWRPSRKPGEPSWIGLPGAMARQLPLMAVARGDTKQPEGGTLSSGTRALSVPPTEQAGPENFPEQTREQTGLDDEQTLDLPALGRELAAKLAGTVPAPGSVEALLELLSDRDRGTEQVIRSLLDGLPAHTVQNVREELLAARDVRSPSRYVVAILQRLQRERPAI